MRSAVITHQIVTHRTITLTGVGRMIAVLIAAVFIFLPVYISFIGAFTFNGSIARDGLFPHLDRFTLKNFSDAVTTVPLGRQYLVSLSVVALQTFGQLVTSALAAYALVFPKWRGKPLAFALVLITLAIPAESIIIPNYEAVSQLGLRDTILGVVVPYIAAGFPIFLLRQAFVSLPHEMWEAARLDGAGDVRALFAIIMPATRPQVTTAVMWSALSAWNGYFWPLLITDSATSRTIQVGVAQLALAEVGSPAVIFAGAVLVIVPTMLLVIFAQRFLINGLARSVRS